MSMELYIYRQAVVNASRSHFGECNEGTFFSHSVVRVHSE